MLRNRINLVLATIGLAAAVCGFPVALAAAVTSGDVRAAPAGTGAGPGGGQPAAVVRSVPAGLAGPQNLFPIPTQGPPRQFPLPGPTPSPTPPPRRTTPPPPPPPRPAPVVTRPAPPPVPAPPPKPAPVVPKPVVTPKPTPKPPPPPPPPPLPPAPYHAIAPHHLNTALVVFVVAIVPVSLARVRR